MTWLEPGIGDVAEGPGSLVDKLVQADEARRVAC